MPMADTPLIIKYNNRITLYYSSLFSNKNAPMPESQLRKKHHSISYHMSREAVASGACRMAKEYTKTNILDLFTKVLARPRRELLLDCFTY